MEHVPAEDRDRHATLVTVQPILHVSAGSLGAAAIYNSFVFLALFSCCLVIWLKADWTVQLF